MTTTDKDKQISIGKLNAAIDITINGIDYKLVATHRALTPTPKDVGKNIEAVRATQKALNFEGFDGTVHLYLLKDTDGENVYEYVWQDKGGKDRSLKPETDEKLYCLDFRNQSGSAIALWKCSFRSPDINLTQDNLVNANIVSTNGDDYVLSAVTANARIPAGETLKHKIIFAAKGQTPIAHNFQLFSGDLGNGDKVSQTPEISPPKSDGKFDFNEYKAALEIAPLFFEANESGKRSSNRVKWRYGDSSMQDGADVGRDLSGGHYDAGDMLKTAMGEGYVFSNIAFTMHLYKAEFKKIGQWEHYKRSLTHACNWLMKSHEYKNGITERFFHWIPYSKNTHNEWEIPEKAKHKRNTYVIDKNHRGSEPIHNTGSCLANAYLVYKDENPNYAKKCLEHSQALFNFGTKYPGKYKSQTVYASSSGYQDERVHHGVSLYAATGDKKYLNDANHIWNTQVNGAYGWFNHLDNSSFVSLFLLAKYDGNEKFHNNVKHLFDAWATGTKGVKTIDGKLRAINDWATCSQGGGMGGLFALYSHFVRKNQSYENFNLSQINYILGDNKDKYSYVIGFGDKWLRSPHHRGSAGLKDNGQSLKMHESGHNKNPLIGALIGGKKLSGYFPADGSASRSDWICAEVALNYQCNLVLSLAGALKTSM